LIARRVPFFFSSVAFRAWRSKGGGRADSSAHCGPNSGRAPTLLATREEIGEGADFTPRRGKKSAEARILLRDAERNRRRRGLYSATRSKIGEATDFSTLRDVEKRSTLGSLLRFDHFSKKFFIRFLFSCDLHSMGPIEGPKTKFCLRSGGSKAS